jgi:WhiB family transcriptional regulator, redox-sensing transcriptional regulator
MTATNNHARRSDWLRHAVCARRDPDIWFPDSPGRDGGQAARRICATCPVRPQCLQYALAINPTHGIWAGYNADQLRAMRAA